MSKQTYGVIILIVGIYLLIVAALNKSRFFVGSASYGEGYFSNTFKKISTVITGLFLIVGAFLLFTENYFKSFAPVFTMRTGAGASHTGEINTVAMARLQRNAAP